MVLVFTLACVKKVLRRWQLIPSLSCCFAISASSLKLLSVGDKLKAADGGTKHLWSFIEECLILLKIIISSHVNREILH